MSTNSGKYNSGDFNSGNRNSGNSNSGDFNSGYYNTGDHNSGDFNSGDYNSGDHNSGNQNSGCHNSGNCNSGHYNSGNCNSGNCNSGNQNSGCYNSGCYNSGYYNTGKYNSGFYNNGFFNTSTPDKIMMFDKWVNMSRKEVMKKYSVLYNICPQPTEWVSEDKMTDEEKEDHPEYKTTGGYLKVRTYEEAWAKWWSENEYKHEAIKALPNFDADVFKRITGIDVRPKEETIIIEGKEYTMSQIKKALGK